MTANFNLAPDELKLIAKYENAEEYKIMSKNEFEHNFRRKITSEAMFKNAKPG